MRSSLSFVFIIFSGNLKDEIVNFHHHYLTGFLFELIKFILINYYVPNTYIIQIHLFIIDA